MTAYLSNLKKSIRTGKIDHAKTLLSGISYRLRRGHAQMQVSRTHNPDQHLDKIRILNCLTDRLH